MSGNLLLKNNIFNFIAYLAVTSWSLTGITILGGIIIEPMMFILNLIIGVGFVIVGWFLYLKLNNIKQVIVLLTTTENKQICERLIRFETILFALCALLGILLLSGAISRVFIEQKAVFG